MEDPGNMLDQKLGIIVFAIDVGCIPPAKAEAFMSRLKEKVKMLSDWHTFWVPVRPPNKTRVEVFSITPKGLEQIKPYLARAKEFIRIKELEAKLEDAQETIRCLHEQHMNMVCKFAESGVQE